MLLDTIQLHLELNMVSETIMRSLTLYTLETSYSVFYD